VVDGVEVMNQFEKIEDEMHDFNTGPKQAKGGVFSSADVPLIKRALLFFAKNCFVIEDHETKQLSNLLHRLERIN
jgi:hypothetical protein